jgi:uncharacterized repeat protein (TIGR01451 family)
MNWRRRASLLLLLAAAFLPAGCNTSNPTYFPWWKPFGEIRQTHAKPSALSYFKNFDPYACRVEVRPLEQSSPVGTQYVIIATVYDGDGDPRRSRRVEWMLEGVGHIVEVDESGWHNNRGYKVDTRYAVSHTDYLEHTFTRGNDNPNDDFTIRPGQSWCVISSPVEGDTFVTVYCPAIHNWDRHKVTVTTHWINAGWTIAPPASNRTGQPHTLTTQVYRVTDRLPVQGYRVRYTILDGPPATYTTASRMESPVPQRVAEAISDSQGNASVVLTQLQPQAGVNRIGVEIIRPPDPTQPTSPAIVIGRGETYKEWAAPNISIQKLGPAAVSVGQIFNYTITVTNAGQIESDGLTVREIVPEGTTFMSSSPAANQEGRDLIWTLGPLAPGRSATIQASFRADRAGTISNTATVLSAEGIRADSTATTQVATPGLQVSKTGPETGFVGAPITYQIVVRNTGSGPASNVMLLDEFDNGLEHAQSGSRPVELSVGTLGSGETRNYTLVLTPRREGQLVNRVRATGDGGVSASGEHPVMVSVAPQPRLSLSVNGPDFKYIRGQADFNIVVTNTGDTPLHNVVVRNQIPAEMNFVQASEGGQSSPGGQVVWNLGTLPAREERRLRVTAQAERVTARAVNAVTATADPLLTERAEAVLEIRGAPGLRLEVLDTRDPIEIDDQTTYEIRVTNQGTLEANGIEIAATLPDQMKLRSAVGPGNSQPKVDGRKISFPVQNNLQPGLEFAYTIVVDAAEAGDARFNVELRSASLGPDPVRKSESTNIYKASPNGKGGADAPPAAAPRTTPTNSPPSGRPGS